MILSFTLLDYRDSSKHTPASTNRLVLLQEQVNCMVFNEIVFVTSVRTEKTQSAFCIVWSEENKHFVLRSQTRTYNSRWSQTQIYKSRSQAQTYSVL
jgi:hypothetical protein